MKKNTRINAMLKQLKAPVAVAAPARCSASPTGDVELDAIQTVLNALKPLGYKSRDRVLEYAKSWCDDPGRSPGTPNVRADLPPR